MSTGFSYSGNTRKRTKSGYLKGSEMYAIRSYLQDYRKEKAAASFAGRQSSNQDTIKDTQASKQDTYRKQKDVDRTVLHNRLGGTKAMLGQAEAVLVVKKIPSRTDLSPDDYNRLRDTVQAIESKRYANALFRCEIVLEREDSTLQSTEKEIMSISEALGHLLWAFQ